MPNHRNDVKNDSKFIQSSANNSFVNCEIAYDAAKKLGISPRTLRYKIAQLKSLETPEFSFE